MPRKQAATRRITLDDGTRITSWRTKTGRDVVVVTLGDGGSCRRAALQGETAADVAAELLAELRRPAVALPPLQLVEGDDRPLVTLLAAVCTQARRDGRAGDAAARAWLDDVAEAARPSSRFRLAA